MINADKRKAIFVLYQEGKRKKQIARDLRLDPKTVRKIVADNGELSQRLRRDKVKVDQDLLRKTHEQCEGYLERVRDVLMEEHDLEIGYSTLTRLIRELQIGQATHSRCGRVPDRPGAEMQHDSSPYRLLIGDAKVPVICSGLYYRYCKMRYIKFYRSFNRFAMKCFLHEAITHFGYAAKICVIDNTNLAVWYGTGADAVFHPEMIAFGKNYGFDWLAHEKGHSNRKAGKERNFWTVETNFFPGRSFKSMTDLNHQAFKWSTETYAKRPLSKTRLIPVELFEVEKPYLNKLPPYVEPPYQEHERDIDQYGYAAFEANYYWVPGTSRGSVKLIEYPDRIRIFKNRQHLIEYPLPDPEVRNKTFSPEGIDTHPYQPKNRRKGCEEEEKRLRLLGVEVGSYLDFVRSKESDVRQKPQFIRRLYGLSKKVAPSLFLNMIKRALNYRVTHMPSLERICVQLMTRDGLPLPEIGASREYEQRESYQQGRFCEEADLKDYQAFLEDQGEEEDDG
jgi:transposase